MLNNILASGGDPFRSANIGEASLYALIGFSVVFVGILFLILVVWGTGKIISAFEGKTASTKKKTKQSVKAETVEQPTVQPTETDEISEETIAIITAAIMAYYQENNPKCEFTLKRIKRI